MLELSSIREKRALSVNIGLRIGASSFLCSSSPGFAGLNRVNVPQEGINGDEALADVIGKYPSTISCAFDGGGFARFREPVLKGSGVYCFIDRALLAVMIALGVQGCPTLQSC